MTNLNTYETEINNIRKRAREAGISNKEINAIFEKCFQQLENEQKGILSVANVIGKTLLTIFLISTACVLVLYNHPSTHSFMLRNLQHIIYPGLTAFRNIAVPVITKYPELTNLYDEWCVIENPYFHVSEMDCWPCSSIVSVPDLTGHNITKTFNSGIPFTKFYKNKNIYFHHLQSLYNREKTIFDTEAKNVVSNNLSYRIISNVMKDDLDVIPSPEMNLHVTWKITRLQPGRLIRKLFSRPEGIPVWWGQSTERFIFIDEPKSPSYSLPNPECSNIIIHCTSGARFIRLNPSPECIQNCRRLTVLLSAGQSLWYNWWYWRPESLPAANQTETTINYLTSFC